MKLKERGSNHWMALNKLHTLTYWLHLSSQDYTLESLDTELSLIRERYSKYLQERDEYRKAMADRVGSAAKNTKATN